MLGILLAKEQDYLSGTLFNTTTYRYDLSGRLTGLTDTEGQKINYVYDKYNRVTHEYYSAGENSVTTTYDYGNNGTSSEKTGLIYGISYDGVLRRAYGYDSLNGLTGKHLWGNDTF